MRKIRLLDIAHARSGDKGNSSNVGLIAKNREAYDIIAAAVTAEKVKSHFGDIVKGDVERYDLPNLLSLNFILHDSLGGGGSQSLKNDAQGKTHGQGLLLMEIEIPDEFTIGMDENRPSS
ncbi:MAG: hypothetical protein IIB39_07295 [Candidatus Marinimicrobia bacterium]|nr:hypothetical protein [Candidatus Neomarinimicrobiota bacterium]